MEKTAWSWARKGVVALLAVLVAGCCMFLAGCAENSEEAVRNAVSEEFDQIKNADMEAIEEIAGDSAEFKALEAYNITATDAYAAIFSDFDYQIESVKVEGDKAVVGIKFTAKDLSQFQSELVAAAQQMSTDGSLTGLSTSEINAKIGEMVLNTIKALPTTETDVIDFDCVKKNGKWQLTDESGVVLQEAVVPANVMAGY